MSGSGFTNDVMHAENVDFSGGFPVSPQVVLDGQLLIGSTAAPNIKIGTLTAGSGVSITNGSGSITIGLTGGGIASWTDQNTSFAAVAFNGYFITSAGSIVATLPASPTQGQTIAFASDNATGTVVITANTGQIIRMGLAVSATAGTATSTQNGDSITLVFRSSDNAWIAIQSMGTFIVT